MNIPEKPSTKCNRQKEQGNLGSDPYYEHWELRCYKHCPIFVCEMLAGTLYIVIFKELTDSSLICRWEPPPPLLSFIFISYVISS